MTRQKGARWKRGEACVSNPRVKKHRLEAASVVRSKRQKTAAEPEGDGLGVALKNLDENTDNLMNDDEVTHISALSTWTIASGAAGTLPSFDRVRKLWNSPLDSHKEVCAVLTAITEVIKSQGEEESPIAYFAALLTALESASGTEQLTAITYLLGLVIPSVPQTILRAKFAPASKLLFTVLESQTNKDLSVALVRSLLTSISHLLTQQDHAIWTESSVVRMLEFLIQFVFHTKPKIRHSAQRSLALLSRTVPVACSLVLKNCCKKLDAYTGSKEAQVTLHTVSFIRYVLPHASEAELRTGLESLLRVVALKHTKVASAALQALTTLFKQECQMTGEMQGQILMNLYSNKPASYDHPITTVWLEALSSSYSHLAKLEPKLGIIMAHSLFSVCSDSVLSKNYGVVQTTLVALEEFCVTNIPPGLDLYEDDIKEKKTIPMVKVLTVLKDMLKLTYQSVWDVVLQVVGSLFQNLAPECVYLIEPLIPALFVIREAPDFNNNTLFNTTVGSLVKLIGPQRLLTVFPLSFESGDTVDIPNGWLLPILRDNVSNSELKFFVSDLVPITATLRTRAETLKSENKDLDAKVCFNLEYQIWSLLPSFCKTPSDLLESFKVIAKTIGTLIGQRSEIRNILCSSLISLIETCQTDDQKIELGRFAKNFLPVLFNIFLTEPKPEDPPLKPVIDCVESYLSICPQDTLHVFFEKLLAKSKEEVMSDHVKKVVLELLVTMISHLSLDDLNTMYSEIVPWLSEPGNSNRQKRAYQILWSILEGRTEAHDRFVISHLDDLYKHLAESLSLAQPGAKKHRLKCLLSLVKKLDIENFEFVPSILPEIVLCVKEQNEKTRVAAYKCLTAIGYVYLDKSQDKRLAMKNYIEMIIAGVTGQTHLASATLLCLSKIVYEYNSYLETEVLDQILEIVVALMESKQREILKGVIAFIKAGIGVIHFTIMEPYVKPLLDGFCTWEKPMRHHFRAKVRVILERLLRRFGYELVHKLAGEEHKKVINHIVKEQRREKAAKSARWVERKKEESEDGGLESDGDEEMMDDFKRLRGRGSRSEMPAKLVEGDNPLDFLDSSMIPKIYKGTKKEPCSLPEKDGKFVIEDLAKKIEEAMISEGEENEADSEDEVVKAATNPFGRPSKGIYRDTKSDRDARSNKKPGPRSDGTKYKSSKAAGDMKKKGKDEPYAYVSINQKKGKSKSRGQFDNLIKAGKAGVLKGAKSRGLKGKKVKSRKPT